MINTKFAYEVREVVRNIPKGETRSYKEVAYAAGRPGAARAVGTIMKHNYDATVPCHRVVRSDGKIGDYNRGGAEAKWELLQKEGATVGKRKAP
jgi:methylated-DNA-[protein]-cysteine S-methyltransferase